MSDLIIFDLDNTIIKGDSDRNWGEFLSEQSNDLINTSYYKTGKQITKINGTL